MKLHPSHKHSLSEVVSFDQGNGILYSPWSKEETANFYNQPNISEKHVAKIWSSYPKEVPKMPQTFGNTQGNFSNLFVNGIKTDNIYTKLVDTNGNVIPNKSENITINMAGEKIKMNLKLEPNNKDGNFHRWIVDCGHK